MSEVAEVVESTIDKVLERVDLIASKLGIAAQEVWKFTVAAKLVEARRDLWKSGLLALMLLPFWGWTVHVATMRIPHEIESRSTMGSLPCQVETTPSKDGKLNYWYMCGGGASISLPPEDKGVSPLGWIFVVTGVMTAIAGLTVACMSVEGIVNALADAHTAEYDAYQDLISDWRD